MSPAAASVSNPVWKTLAAIASEASAAGRFTVGRQIRSHKAEMASSPWPCAPSQDANVCWSSAGSFRSSRARAKAARPRPNRALSGSRP